MKAISLWQPWASLLVDGEKRIETRSWPLRVKFPCVIAIHAAKKWNASLATLCGVEPFASSLAHCGIYVGSQCGPRSKLRFDGMDGKFGAIIGIVRVAGCATSECLTSAASGSLFMPGTTQTFRYDLTDKERAFGDYSPGRFGWCCDEFCGLSIPVPCTGRQGLFQWEPPSGLILPEWAR